MVSTLRMRVAPLLVTVAIVGCGAARANAAEARAPSAPAPAGTAGRGPASGGLPDSVLARVGTHREISAGQFRRAWGEVSPPARPDSLTPQSARQFLQLLIGKECLAEAATRETWVWTRPESAKYQSTRDRLVLRAALEGPLAEARAGLARAGRPADDGAAGIAARDSAAARMHVVFEEAVVSRVARAFAALPKPSRDSGLFAQLRVLSMSPVVGPRDSLAVIARTLEGDYRVADLLEWWRNLSAFARPRVDTAAQVRDLVTNALFERKLRRIAAARDLEHRPDIAAELARQREFIAVSHLVEREVYDSLDADSAALRRWYDARPDSFALPLRVRALRLVLPSRADAGRMAARLRDRAQAESLEAIAVRQKLGYIADLTAWSDSALFAQGLRAGAGAVVGPDSVKDGWAVARVIAIQPARRRSFEEARTLVEHDRYSVEGERRMVELIARLRRTTPVIENQAAIASVARR